MKPIQIIRRALISELVVGLMFVLAAGLFAGFDAAKSSLLGVLAYSIPNAYRTIRTFRHEGARSAKLIVKDVYQGEAVKFALSIVVFACVFSRCTVNPMIFFGTYIGMQMLISFAPLLIEMKTG